MKKEKVGERIFKKRIVPDNEHYRYFIFSEK